MLYQYEQTMQSWVVETIVSGRMVSLRFITGAFNSSLLCSIKPRLPEGPNNANMTQSEMY